MTEPRPGRSSASPDGYDLPVTFRAAAWVVAVSATPSPTGSPGRPGSSGLGGWALVIFLIVIALIVIYRQKVLRPFMERYERPPPPDRPGSRPEDEGPEDRPTG